MSFVSLIFGFRLYTEKKTVMHRRVQNVFPESKRRIFEEIFDRGPEGEFIPRFGTSALWSRQIREVFLNSWWMLHYMTICLAPYVKTFEKDVIGTLGVADLTFLSGRVITVHLTRAWRYEIFSDPIGIRESRPSSSDESLQDQLLRAGNGSMSSSGDVLLPDSVAGRESSDALLLHRSTRMTSSDSISPDLVERSPNIAELEDVRPGFPTDPAWIQATDLYMGILAFLLEILLIWITDSWPFELVVLVVSWINCLTAWTIFLWGARWRVTSALPRYNQPNRQPNRHPIDYVEKYTSLALVVFTTIAMIFKFSNRNFSTTGLVLYAMILGAKLGIEYQKRHSD